MSLLSVKSVSRIYQGVIVALNDVSFILEKGDTVALLGSSGSGKSTLLSLIAGYDSPTNGSIHVQGRDLNSWPKVELLTRKIGFLFQQFHLIEHLTAVQNIELAMFPVCNDRIERYSTSMKLLERVGLSQRANSRAINLSGGERQRVAFCRSIVNQPELLLADEPTGNLDTTSRQALLELIQEHNVSCGGTFLIATHDPDVARICDRIITLEDGEVVVE
ncbi:MAG: ABC transporter ATP-binding protein [Gammaproteobacteria bacterium]|nr:ABC transporter ATP-binding protein [Gammaproteobacteria bacterium]